ncbi:hypothetical protein BDQ17DRAFT_677401 [Cyathus striatus]|nr:hypothetical protein BDQ17DRAFT_677401 [Cyathus striatus]
MSPSPPTPSSSLPTSPSSIDVYSSAGPFVQGSSKDSQIDTPSIPEAPSKNIPDMKLVVKMLDKKIADGVVDTDALLAELCSYCMQRMDHAREAENFIRDIIREKILELQTKPKEDILEDYFSDSEASSDSQEPGLSTPSLATASPQNLDQEEPESIASTRTTLDNDLNIATSVINISDESNTLSREPLADSSYAIKQAESTSFSGSQFISEFFMSNSICLYYLAIRLLFLLRRLWRLAFPIQLVTQHLKLIQ